MDDLGRLLERERALILRGDLAGAAALAPLKEAAAPRWGEAGRLLGLARRNGALLRAAIEGLRDAARGRAAAAEARGRLGTYDAQGARAESLPAPRVERRA